MRNAKRMVAKYLLVILLGLVLLFIGAMLGVDLVFIPILLLGWMVTWPLTLLTGWECSRWVGGHGPNCELFIGTAIILALLGWSTILLIKKRV